MFIFGSARVIPVCFKHARCYDHDMWIGIDSLAVVLNLTGETIMFEVVKCDKCGEKDG